MQSRATPGRFCRGRVSAYRQLDPGNARLHNLVRDLLDSDARRLLWMPPSRYHEPEASSPCRRRSLTKRLSSHPGRSSPRLWRHFLTYEAERRMIGIPPEGELDNWPNEERRGLPLLQ
jgi:hypothetical protein